MSRVFNFSAGPSMLPEAVLQRAQAELLDCGNTGMSVMEMSHRSKFIGEMVQRAESDLRSLMSIPDHYHVLFLQGGASTQFAMLPLNLMVKGRADFVVSGNWSKKALAEASRYGECRVVASSEDRQFTYVPELGHADWDSKADYVHITSNNTIFGTRFTEVPDTGDVVLACDMSSGILSEPVEVERYGLIYAGAQKNIGPAGVTIVVIREDLLGRARDDTPTMLNYQTHAAKGSLYNTPPVFGIYMAGLVFRWLLENGGLETMHRLNLEKAGHLYDFLDRSQFFRGTVRSRDRSLMNVPFLSPNAELDQAFIEEAQREGLVNLKGYRTVGGMRASIYNAMPIEGVRRLVAFMTHFENRHI